MDEEENDISTTEAGSDELLSDDNLRLPESASMLVRLHAIRAWLARRQRETNIEIGEAALDLQQAMSMQLQEARLRRREREQQEKMSMKARQALAAAQERLQAYEEAEALLEDCVAHTGGERVLVEYYLALEDLARSEEGSEERSERQRALAAVQHRIERVGIPHEEE